MSTKKDNLEVTVSDLLTEERDLELGRRDGEWNAFTHAVFHKMDSEEVAVARADLEDQAIELFKGQIDLELSEMAPRFEEAFKESVEKRIFRSAIEPTFGERAKTWWAKQKRELSFGLGMMGAATAAAALVLFAPINTKTPNVEDHLATGHVSVQQISFEGDVTVLPDDGVTIIWLDELAS